MFSPFHSLYINTFTSKLQPNNIIYFNIVKQVVLITFLELIKVKINNGICSLFLNKCIIKVLLTLSIIKKIRKEISSEILFHELFVIILLYHTTVQKNFFER